MRSIKPTFILSLFLLLFVMCTPKTAKKVNIPEGNPTDKNLSVHTLNDEDLSLIYSEAINYFYPYCFDVNKPKMTGEMPNNGDYICGTKGLVLYADLREGVAAYLTKIGTPTTFNNNQFYNVSLFAELANIPHVFSNTKNDYVPFGFEDEELDFNRLEKEMVTWGVDHLIPSPTTKIGEREAGTLYSLQFKRYFRLMTEAYLYLVNDGFKTSSEAYQKAGREDEYFNGVNYLSNKYKFALSDYTIKDNYSCMNPPVAIGFWMRRDIDGTKSILWTGLTRLMLIFDKDWFKENVDVSLYR